MATINLTPNMNLPNPIPGLDSGPDYADSLQSSLDLIDQHDHSSGNGVPINPSGLNINATLLMNSFGTSNQGTVGFSLQANPLPSQVLTTLYCTGLDLYFNDGSGNAIQLTKSGGINATSSGISSGTATAAFSSGVLVVNAASLTPANIQVGSVLIGNNVASSNFLTLAPPSAMAASFTLTLPNLPSTPTLLGMDTSGNFTTNASAIVTGANIAAQTITQGNLALRTVAATAPAGGVATSVTSGSFTTTSTSFVFLFQCSLVTTGRPVTISLQTDGSSVSVLGCLSTSVQTVSGFFIQLLRGSTIIGGYEGQVSGAGSPTLGTTYPGVSPWLDTPAAGTYLYSLQVLAFTGSQLSVINMRLVAYEL